VSKGWAIVKAHGVPAADPTTGVIKLDGPTGQVRTLGAPSGDTAWVAKKQDCEQRDVNALWFFLALSAGACVAVVAYAGLFPGQ